MTMKRMITACFLCLPESSTLSAMDLAALHVKMDRCVIESISNMTLSMFVAVPSH